MAQPSSGTVAFQPALSDLVLEAFSRIQIRPTSLTADHMFQCRMSANLLLSEWAVRPGPNLWKQERRTLQLVQGQATYAIAKDVTAILDYTISSPQQGGNLDYVITPISRTEYEDIPNKTQQARTTSVFFLRTITPSLTLWPVPDGNGPYTLNYWVVAQIQDAVLPGGVTVDMPYRFDDAFAAALAARLARKYPPPPPATIADLREEAEQAWMLASGQDIEEGVPLYLEPGLTGYFRR